MSELMRTNGNLFPSFLDFNRSLFDWDNNFFSPAGSGVPAVNIRETADNFEVEMAAPGLTKKDFNIELDNNMLIISADMEQEKEEKEGERFTRKEFSRRSFRRTFTLPKQVVEVDKIQARYENGILRLVVPKKEEAKPVPPKRIAIH